MKQILWIVFWVMMVIESGLAKTSTYYGIVIGCCSNYPYADIRGLHAKDDAKNFYDELIDIYYNGNQSTAKEKIYLLSEKDATKANIKATLKKVVKKAEKGDVVYFFFSGHGSSLEDKNKIIKTAYESKTLVEMMENSGLIIPYDFDIKKTSKTAIIGRRDLRVNDGYGFKNLDDKGVQVIMISDSCYSGNIFRSTNGGAQKYIPRHQLKGITDEIDEFDSFNQIGGNKPKDRSAYKNLIFFSAGGTDKAVTEDRDLKRGKFSLVVEKCIKTSNLNLDSKITKKEFEECLKIEDSARAFVSYPTKGKHANFVVFKKLSKDISISNRDKIRIKSSIKRLNNMGDYIIIDNENYDIEIVHNSKGYSIFRYTGEQYAVVDEMYLQDYLEAFRIFKLKGKDTLDIRVVSQDSRKEEGVFCKGEILIADIETPNIGQYIVALTLNKEGGIIMLQPNDYSKSSSTIIEAKVEKPYGMDKIKVFTLSSEKQYEDIKKLMVSGGLLNNYGVKALYKILKSNHNFREREIDIQTIERSIDECRKGDR